MKIGEIAKASGISKDTVRLYERMGLLVEIGRPFQSNNYKDYSEQNVERIELIRQMQQVGFSLHDCKLVLMSTQDSDFDQDIRSIMLQEKVDQIEMKIKDLRKLKQRLLGFVKEE